MGGRFIVFFIGEVFVGYVVGWVVDFVVSVGDFGVVV